MTCQQQKIAILLNYFSISVGGGSAGSVLAARLSEISDWNILLIEAGGEQSRKVNIPWFHLWLVDSPHDWKYSTEPQKDALWAFDDQVKFIYSEKTTKFCEIFTLLLTVCTVVKSKVKISQNL